MLNRYTNSGKVRSCFAGLLLLLTLFPASRIQAQSSITFDTEYWFAAPYTNSAYWGGTAFRISAFDDPANVRISVPLNGSFVPRTVTVPANSTQSVFLTNAEIGQVINSTGNGIMPTGILIETDAKISAYYEPGGGSQSPDLVALKGSEALGTEFMVPMQQESSLRSDGDGQQGFAIVATEDNTSVTITPKAAIAGRAAGVPFTITMNRGETYFAQNPGIAPAVSGSTVSSDKPVAVTIFSELMLYGATSADLGSEQLVPVSSLGTTYMVVRGYRTGTDIVYFTAVEDNTSISVNGAPVATLNATDTYELQTNAVDAYYVEASKPVTALQLSGVIQEESFSLLPPLSACNGSNVVSVVRASSGAFYMNIVSPVNSGFLVNGDPSLLAASAFTALGATGWYYARVAVPVALVSAGNPVIVSNTDPTARFQMGVFHTNLGGARYGYFSSYSGITINFNQSAAVRCEGEAVTFTPSVLSTDPVTSYSWTGPNGFTSSEANLYFDNLTAAQSGEYVLEVSSGGCTVQASVNLTVNATPAAPVSGGNQYVCAADPVQTLTATATVPATDKITWYDAPTGGNVVTDPSLSSVGTVTYYAEARNGTQCVSASRTPVSLVIEAGPDIDPPGDQVACGGYELPAITGSDLTGNEAYFTGPGGTGTRYEPGDIISTPGINQLYIYDKAASVANCVGSLTATGNASLPPDHPLYVATHRPYPGTIDPAFWQGTASQLIQHGAPAFEQVYHTIVGDLSIGSTAGCFGTEVEIEASVTIRNAGPGNAAGYPGRLAIANKATGEYLYQASLPVNFPANTTFSPVVTGTVPLTDLSAGNIVIVISLETNQLNLVKNWELSNFKAGYTFIPANTIGCADEEIFTVTVNPALPAPTSGGDQEEPAAGQTLTATASLPASAPAGATIVWYDAPTGGNQVPDPSLSTNGRVTYYAEIQAGDCRGPRTPVTLTLTPLPPEVCGNGVDDDGNGVADCDDPACNPFANYFANGSMERYTQCPPLTGAGSLEYVVSWKTSQPASTGGTGGQLMVNDPIGGCVAPRPASSWNVSNDLPAGSDGVAWGGMHGGNANQPSEDFQNTLVNPLPAGTYTFKFSAGYLTQAPFTSPGRFRFYGVKPGEADFTTAHPLGFSPMIDNAISAASPEWKEYSFTFTSSEVYDRIYIVAYSGPTGRAYMVFDGFSMASNTPDLAFRNLTKTCSENAVLEVTNADPSWTGFRWYLDGTLIPGANGSTYQPMAGQDGIYTVQAVIEDNCLTAMSPGIEVSADCPVPFECNGSAYLVSAPNSATPSTLSIVAAHNPGTVHATLSPSIADLYNGIGYNFEDNLIYGYSHGLLSSVTGGSIVQIDSRGTVKVLGIPTSTQAGRGMDTWTISPAVNPNGAVVNLAPGVIGLDNKFYALVTTSSPGERYLATVDLTTMTYTTVRLSANYVSSDLAFSPYDGMLYGLAGNSQLVRTNPENGNQQVVTPSSGTPPAAGAGGAWNDVQGRVYFYANGGAAPQGGQRLYRYNPVNGVFANVTGVTPYPTFDATACFPTRLEKAVVMPAGGINPGDVVEMRFSIYNTQMVPITYEFEDMLTSPDLSWVADAVDPAAPGGGTVTISGQTLTISGITVPPVSSTGGVPLTFTVSLKVADNAANETCYTNQASITTGGMTVLSDDPASAEENDPTEFCLNPCTVLLTVGQLSCDPGSGTYSVSYISNGTVSSTAGTVDMANSMITGIPLGTDITITSSCSGSSTTANVAGLATCPDDCVLPDLSLGQPLCGPGGTYIVGYNETTGALISVTGGTDNGNGTITGTIGTPVTVTAGNGACTTTLSAASPTDCGTPCKNPAISIGGSRCSADGSPTYEVSFTALPDAVITVDNGVVNLAEGVITGIPLGTDATITIGYLNCPDQVIIVPSSKCNRDFTSRKAVSDASGDGQAQAGEELTYTISIENTGDINLTAFAINDVIPAGTTYLDGSADNGGVYNAGGNALNWTVNVPAGTTLDVSFKVTVNDNLTGIAEIANQATVTDPEDPDNPEEPGSPPVPTDPVRDFDPDKSVADASGDGNAQAGEELTYTISIENTGNVDLTGFTVSDPIPAGTSYLDGSADNGGVFDPATGQVDWTVDIPFGTTLNITFKVTVDDNLTGVDEIANKATITDPEDPDNPEEPESPPVPTDPVRDFDSHKSVADASGDGSAQAGEELTYTISIENTGNVDLTGFAVADPVPAGTTYLDGSADNGGVFDQATGQIDWTVDIPYGETTSLTFKVTVNDNLTGVDEIANQATVTDPEDPGNPEEPESPPVPTDPVRDFDSDKSVVDASGDGNAQAGEELTYTITIENTGNVDIAGLLISDPIPTGTTYLDGSADNGGVFNEGAGQLDWTMDVPYGATISISFKVTVNDNLTGIAEIANKATITDPEDPDNPEEPESPPVPTDPVRDFDPDKSVTDASGDGMAQAGEELTYTISIENTGDVDLTGFTVTDPIPAGTTYLTGSADNGGVFNDATGQVDWTVDIPFGTTLHISFKVTVNDNLTGIAEIANKATITDPEDPDNPEEPESPPVPTDPVRDFDSDKSVADADGDGMAQAGEELTYTISIENTGSTDLTGMTISDPIPAGTTYLDGSADNGGVFDNATGQLNWTVNIPFGETLDISFKVTVNENLTGVAEIANKATITDPEDPDNPEEPETPPVPTDPVRDFDSDKSVTDASGDGKAQAGEELTYTITIANTGNVDLTSLLVTDPVPAGTTYLDGSADNGGMFDPVNSQLDWTVDVPYGETLDITFKVTVSDNLTGIAEIANKATITDPEDPDNPEEPETPPVPADPVRDYDTDKTVVDASGDGTAQAGEELTYTITIENTGDVDLTGLMISDPVPAGTTYLDGSADNGGVLDGAAGTLNWTVDVPFGETLNVSFKVSVNENVTGISAITNKATVTDPEDPGNPEEPETPPVPVEEVRDFDSEKTVVDASGDGKAQAGEELTYIISIENTGNVDLTGLTIGDPVPDGTAYLEGSADNGGMFNETDNRLDWTVTVPFGETLEVTFKVRVSENLTGISGIANKAAITDPEDPDNPEEPETPPVPVDVIRDFETNKTVTDAGGDGNARAGEEMTYTITIENTGNVDLNDFTVTDEVPDNTEYVEGSADSEGTFADNKLSWTVDIPYGESKLVSFKVTVAGNLTGIDQITNTATVTDPENPDDPREPSSPDVPVFIPDPIANDDEGEVETGDEVVITIMDNDETDGSPLDPSGIEIIDEPLHGTLTVNADGTVTYTPDTDFAGRDNFTYRVRDEDGNWSNVAVVDITVVARPLNIPNLFTPNGDGRNDTFVIPGLEGFPDNELLIVNRWGNEVFRHVNYKNTWTGEGLNEGTYYYVLRIRNAAGEEQVYKGYITLVRAFGR